ncbi:MAG: glycosyltransferase family 2 protein [Syntrophobacteraceae bacterium]|nr:glycosyltransferase family 2 protein [Syntrophobacteraceae bacterium]
MAKQISIAQEQARTQPAPDSCRISVVIPAFNEEAAIGMVLDDVESALEEIDAPHEIIVVDDGSTDSTGTIVSRREGIRLIRLDENKGYGASLKAGIRMATGDIIVITDADGSYPNGEIPRLIKALDDCDMVVGSRNGESVRIPLVRRLPKWVLGKLANILCGRRIPDLNSGLRAFRKQAYLPFTGMISDGFSFTTTLTLALMCNDFTVKFLPVNYYKRKGKSKIRPFHDTLNFLILIVRLATYFNPLKVFVPPAMLILAAGILHGLYQLISSRLAGIGEVPVLLILAGIQILFLGLLADLISRRPPT